MWIFSKYVDILNHAKNRQLMKICWETFFEGLLREGIYLFGSLHSLCVVNNDLPVQSSQS